MTEKERETINPFIDEEGRICAWPSKHSKKRLVLEYLVEKFELDRVYTEKEVNQRIDEWQTIEDLFLFRRELVDAGLMRRTPNGAEYRRVAMPVE